MDAFLDHCVARADPGALQDVDDVGIWILAGNLMNHEGNSLRQVLGS